MLIHIPSVLTVEEVAHCRQIMAGAEWVDGRVTAGPQSAMVKNNLQIPLSSDAHREMRDIVLRALGRNPTYNSAALPLRVVPPLFNRYDAGMSFAAHVDNAIRPIHETGARVRTDLSSTLFLSEPDEYDGGELVLHEPGSTQELKLPAGDMVLYPTTALHSVNEVTRGSRLASFFWTQSMIADEARRRIMFELDRTIMDLRTRLPDDDLAVLNLTNCYHNLMRQWCVL
ncbi:2OG-Fe(II) oxygenase [Gluconacetobacter diazotrophicus PA1 5]|uniref:PKHD-type hydroxylase GDI1238/Gdia_1949 n=2 Tax=Gluconacetobacter diazotrophicus TaxID=33996 RepID=Y1238_GLUDA|nr:Fe2+-dependent dioxygenase [Gluconacetobacter diazotrophicus]A9HE41.1 RecName: Full=PKHD-type hydroxylase GDI1238/Gdia_1949 [Gluconacetobacter diazotrophicus PA1 5]ACI51709.1 2OG-Fe(II) oxygenase [Gluconacetobacter diazotrophicus PA1 5]MBB2155251.1 Fe2+-dependent dioxygenase [Gluconacetobacter diazotrophicus]TWB11053.1 PKHD-type hydroxylase [Gluconacetobacter diazotrophicus]CAP55181.1 putative PKHD-type hydroxylase [Gluconacetobacter diazotrophicus PA1 5]